MMNTTWSKPTKYLIGVGLVILAIYILHLSRTVIPMLIIATLLAALVRPVIQKLHLHAHFPRGLAVGLVYLCLAILVPLMVILVLPTIIDAITYVGNLDYQGILKSVVEWLRSTLITIKSIQFPIAGFDTYVDKTIETILAALQPTSMTPVVSPSLTAMLQPLSTALKVVMQTGANVVGTAASQAAMIALTFLASIYISLDAHTYMSTFLQAIPSPYQPEISSLLNRLQRVWQAFFHGELKLMLFIGVFTTVGLVALGMPGALYLGIVAGLLEIVPSLGPLIAIIPAAIVALIQGSFYLPISHLAFAVVVIIFYIMVQQVENSLVVPRVLGNALDLPPLIILIGVVVGVSAGGILGALLATPTIATGREILSYIRCKLSNQEYALTEPTVAEAGTTDVKNWLNLKLVAVKQLIKSRSTKPHKSSGNE